MNFPNLRLIRIFTYTIEDFQVKGKYTYYMDLDCLSPLIG
jgi:hypothetical protein